jgi:hypothetical protein
LDFFEKNICSGIWSQILDKNFQKIPRFQNYFKLQNVAQQKYHKDELLAAIRHLRVNTLGWRPFICMAMENENSGVGAY